MKNWQRFCEPENWHSAANVFALLPEDSPAFIALVADIKRYGLNNPIALYKGKVLDGRNRVRACNAAGVEPEFYEWKPRTGQTPETWSASQNICRRHLTADQQKVGDDELRGHHMFKNMRSEYKGFEKEYSAGWKKVKAGEQSLSAFVRQMDWLKSGKKVEEVPFTVNGAAQTLLRLLSYETVIGVYRLRREQVRPEDRALFNEAWKIVREVIYGISTDL